MDILEIWHYLAIASVIAFIIEIFIVSFVFASIGIGLALAALGSYLGLEQEWLIALFSIGTALSYFLIKPIMNKYLYQSNDLKTNQNALIGKTGKVTEAIDNEKNTGRISIDGDDWRAKTSHSSPIEVGEMVKIIEIDSIILIVEPLN